MVALDVDGLNDRFAIGGYKTSGSQVPVVGNFDFLLNDWLWLNVMSGGNPSLSSIQSVTYNLNFTKIAFVGMPNFVVIVLDSTNSSILLINAIGQVLYPNTFPLSKILVFDKNDNFLLHTTSGSYHYHLFMWNLNSQTLANTCPTSN